MKRFIIFFVTWFASNLAIPFWVIGHVHLTINIYKDIYEIIASFWMNILVAIGFYIEWKDYNLTNKTRMLNDNINIKNKL